MTWPLGGFSLLTVRLSRMLAFTELGRRVRGFEAEKESGGEVCTGEGSGSLTGTSPDRDDGGDIRGGGRGGGVAVE